MKSLLVRKDDLDQAAISIINHLKPGDVVTLSGPLAAGKTTLVGRIARNLGYDQPVSSPTFVLEKRYPVQNRGNSEIVHLDFFRLNDSGIKSFDWHEHVGSPDILTFIEWPERLGPNLPEKTKNIKLEVIDEQTRRLTFSKNFSD